ncbi:hypothetical protein MML48_2g00012142 [Holotrichia oblita]|uniref:Uncharacterized protein n=1 Tax=Holotrichia oblita TaxID=644536 RepID=A0ACB9TK22_HOLOL|nr:hypothetical protein MML48_2g00012142 [Holotrichia oblita]
MARKLSGDLRALVLVYNSPEAVPPPLLLTTLKHLQMRTKAEICKLQPNDSEMKSSKESTEPFSTDKPGTSKSSEESKTPTETKCETSKPAELKERK